MATAFLGNQPLTQSQIDRRRFTGLTGNTVYTPYTVGFLQVYLNGALLDPTDYTATDGNSIVFNVTLQADWIVNTIALSTFNVVKLDGVTMSGVNTVPTAPFGTNTEQIANTAFVQQLGIQLAPAAGEVSFFARNTAPTGWLKANGATISRTTYANLFASIGTTFGAGNGSTTFSVPDLRGLFVRGWDDGRLLDPSRTFGSYQADELKSHRHSLYKSLGGGDTPWTSTTPAYPYNGVQGSFGSERTFDTTGLISLTGGTETRPKNLALLACIKY